MSVMAAVCIRCGSKEHSTRDHDEGKIPGGKPAAAPKKVPPKSAPATPADLRKPLQHKVCWKTITRRAGIPALMDPLRDKPIREKFVERKHESFLCQQHINCPCLSCENKKKKAELDWLRKTGKA